MHFLLIFACRWSSDSTPKSDVRHYNLFYEYGPFGMKKRRRLRPNAIPSIFPRPSKFGSCASVAAVTQGGKGQLEVIVVVIQKGGEEL